MMPLFPDHPAPVAGPPPAPVERIEPTSPEYAAFWFAFTRGAVGDSLTGHETDTTRVRQYAADGYRIGELFSPLPCMRKATPA